MPAQSKRLQTIWTTVGDLRIHARVSSGPAPTNAVPIVLVHGFGVSGRYLAPTAARLAPAHAVYVPDLPGSGRSGSPRRALTIDQLADFLAEWMTALDLPRATLLGNSFGCQIIVAFALRHPNRIARAILVSPTIDPSERSPVRLTLRLLGDAARERPSEVAIAMRDYWRFGIRRGTATLHYMKNDPIEKKLPLMTTPTLVVRGGRDPIVSQAWVERATVLLPSGELVVIPEAAHAVNYDTPTALTEAVERFLRETPGAD